MSVLRLCERPALERCALEHLSLREQRAGGALRAPGGGPSQPTHRLDARHAVPAAACDLSCGVLGGLQLDRTGGDGCTLPAAHVRDHRLLPPLFLAPHLQNLPRRTARFRTAGRLGRAARTDLVGRTPPPSSPVFGQARGCALTAAARVLLEP